MNFYNSSEKNIWNIVVGAKRMDAILQTFERGFL